jgi:hypothetical protein
MNLKILLNIFVGGLLSNKLEEIADITKNLFITNNSPNNEVFKNC